MPYRTVTQSVIVIFLGELVERGYIAAFMENFTTYWPIIAQVLAQHSTHAHDGLVPNMTYVITLESTVTRL